MVGTVLVGHRLAILVEKQAKGVATGFVAGAENCFIADFVSCTVNGDLAGCQYCAFVRIGNRNMNFCKCWYWTAVFLFGRRDIGLQSK